MAVVLLVIGIGLLFIAIERIFPGRALPQSPGWYARTALLNLAQVGVVVLAGVTWNAWFRGHSLFDIARVLPAPAQGLLSWFIGTFVFYWWHRARHDIRFLWLGLHQIHHSASRIEILTSFYKHPLEQMSNSIIIGCILFVVLGAEPEAAAWFNLIAATGEMFYHANLSTPRWVGYVMQRPEHHSIHHEFGVHRYNFGDITWWDRLFGTFKEAEQFAARCGFEEGREQRLPEMLAFRKVS